MVRQVRCRSVGRRGKRADYNIDSTGEGPLERTWLKAAASRNIEDIFLTFEVSEKLMGELNDVASSNMPCMSITDAVSKCNSEWLKEAAP